MKKLLSLMCSILMIVTLCGCSSTPRSTRRSNINTCCCSRSLENVFEDKLIPEFEKKIQVSKFKEFMIQVVNYKFKLRQGLKADVFFSAATKQMDALVDEKIYQ